MGEKEADVGDLLGLRGRGLGDLHQPRAHREVRAHKLGLQRRGVDNLCERVDEIGKHVDELDRERIRLGLGRTVPIWAVCALDDTLSQAELDKANLARECERLRRDHAELRHTSEKPLADVQHANSQLRLQLSRGDDECARRPRTTLRFPLFLLFWPQEARA